MKLRDEMTLADATGTTPSGESRRLYDHLNQGRYLLVWWHPQALAPAACRTCASKNGIAEPVRLLMEIHAAGCDVVGLDYAAPDALARYLVDIGLEYPMLSVTREDAREHGVAKVEGEEWETIPHRMAFLVDEHAQVINRYEVHEPEIFLRSVLADVKAGPPPSLWEPEKKPWFRFW